MNNIIVSSNSQEDMDCPFDSIRHYDEKGNEYWLARELMPLLGYSQWRQFDDAIDRAKAACELSSNPVGENFLRNDAKSTGRSAKDYRLSRYGCYLVAMNGDPRKLEIAQAQTYFAVKARQAEVSQQLSPAELLIAQGQAMLAIEKEQARLQAKQVELETKLVLEAQRTAELEQFVHQHDAEIDRLFSPNGHYFSVVGYARNRGLRMPKELAKAIGGKCSQYCKKNGIPVEKLNDSRWGTVGSYPEDVIEMFV